MKNNKFKNDIILIVILLIVAGLAFLIVNALKKPGTYVSLIVDGEITATYSLSEDIEITVRTGENDEDYNVLKISDGKADVTDANCRDRICAKHKPIKYIGETVTCLPHKLVIRIDSDKPDDIDVIS